MIFEAKKVKFVGSSNVEFLWLLLYHGPVINKLLLAISISFPLNQRTQGRKCSAPPESTWVGSPILPASWERRCALWAHARCVEPRPGLGDPGCVDWVVACSLTAALPSWWVFQVQWNGKLSYSRCKGKSSLSNWESLSALWAYLKLGRAQQPLVSANAATRPGPHKNSQAPCQLRRRRRVPGRRLGEPHFEC